ncbi:MAG: sodium-dependent transporter [Oscillospiraceae bacterium]|nr:sodium-dependent transporter [Oscillospiraceae bacterium]
MKRERLGSRLGFILLSAGCAIGCGNVWKFPWLAGQNGGAGFVLLYILCIILIGLPVMTMELALGRAAQASPVKIYQKLEHQGQKWHLHGYLSLFGNICLMSFYTTVAGWMIYYFYGFLVGRGSTLTFDAMLSSAPVNVGFMALVVIVGFFVVSFDLQGGLERVTKYIMAALLVIMLILAVRSFTLSGAAEGLSFYLVPDISKISGKTIVAAMNQAFFTLSLGIGSMAIFGSYLGKDHSLMGEAFNIAALDTFVAIVAGLILFPACFTYDLEVGAGPGLLFTTMATVFNHMDGGRWWGTLFFLFMVFAAMSSVFAVFENILACARELTGWGRRKGSVVCGIVLFATSLTTALGYNVWSGFTPFAAGTSVLDIWDFIVNMNLLPIGCIIYALFCCTRFGWGWEKFVAEANAGSGLKVKAWMKPLFQYVIPAAVLFLYIYGLVTFAWR